MVLSPEILANGVLCGMHCKSSLATALVALFLGISPAAQGADCLRLDLVEGPESRSLLSEPRVEIALELGDVMLVCGESKVISEIERTALTRERIDSVDLAELHLYKGRIEKERLTGLRVIAEGGSFKVLDGPLGHDSESFSCFHARELPLVSHVSLVQRRSGNESRRGVPNPDITALLTELDTDRWFTAVDTLASWNRQTGSSGNLNARDWLAQEFGTLGLAVTTPSFMVGGNTTYNVVGTITGTSTPDDWYIIGGHFDSIPSSGTAPGAEDNASGCAGVLEMARVLTTRSLNSTVIFICFSGEEQGLWGSKDHAQDLVDDGDGSKLKAMLNMDMIGYTGDSELDLLLEGSSDFLFLINDFAAAAALYAPELVIRTTTFYFGSDHVPYLDLDLPAILTIEDDWDSYPDYHQSTDIPANLSLPMGGGVLKTNIAIMATYIGFGEEPSIFADGFESGDTTQWSSVVN